MSPFSLSFLLEMSEKFWRLTLMTEIAREYSLKYLVAEIFAENVFFSSFHRSFVFEMSKLDVKTHRSYLDTLTYLNCYSMRSKVFPVG